MSDLPEIQEVIGRQLRGANLDLIDIVPIPTKGDRMVRLRTLEEALDDDTLGYLVKVRPRPQERPDLPEAQVPGLKPTVGEGVYQPDGKLNIPYLARNAELLYSSGEYALSRNIYKAILQSGERSAMALLGIARCFEAEGKLDEARANYEESLAYHPVLEAYHALSNLLLHQRKDLQAADVLERALNLREIPKPTRYELHKACGNAYARILRNEEAEKHYKKAIEIDPSADEIRANLGALHLQAGRLGDAKRSFQDAVAANPRNDKAIAGLGSCHLAEGDKRAAHDCFARALDIEILNPTAIFHLVKCAYEIKSYATAARILEDYVQVAPVNPNLLYSLAGLQFHLGRMEQARATTTKLLEIAPSHSGAQELLGMIQRYAGE